MVAQETLQGFFPSPGERIAGKYVIERMLGQGGMGAVFSARNELTGKRVALKWLLPDKASEISRQRLLREAQAACAVSHPNVVDVYDVSEHEGGLFIVMEYLQGEPLATLLDLQGYLDPEELIDLLMPAMRGVQAAHDAGVIHRDLKPDNILLCDLPNGDLLPKVVDFGISKTLGGSERLHTSLTNTGALIGTPHFMALEQVDGSGDVDVRTDVYAFGVILYLGLTGSLPFDGDNIGELILKIGTREPAPLDALRPGLDEGLQHVVLRAMARRREDRFSSVEELALALEPYSGGVPFRRDSTDTTARRIPLRSADQPRMSQPLAQPITGERPAPHRLLWAVSASIVLGACLVAGWLWLSGPAGSPPPAAHTAAPDEPAAAAAPAEAPEPLAPITAEAELTPQPPAPEAAPQHGLNLPMGEEPPGSDVGLGERADDAEPHARAASRERRARRERRKLDRRDGNSDNHIRGQRTPGLSSDDF